MISVARRRLVAFAASFATVIGGVIGAGASAAEAAPAGDDAVVAFVVRGVGFGHGQGMSQWGAVGRALDGQEWEDILDAYYGGTQAGTRSDDVRIRLWGWNDTNSAGVISTGGGASWNGNGSYTSLYAIETGANVFSVYGLNGGLACPGTSTLPVPDVVLTHGMQGSDDVEDLQRLLQFFGFDPQGVDGWYGDLTAAALAAFQADEGLPIDGDTWNQDDWEAAEDRLAGQGGVDWGAPVATGVSGPIEFDTTADESSADPGAVLGLCTSSGSIRHYRGSLELHSTPWGNRVVNEVDVENYVRGVVPKESSPAWGDLGDIDPADGEPEGMHALRAQSVSARSFGLSESRYNTSTYPYADTCDTSSCQVYGGAATRSSATAASRTPVEHPNTDAAIADTAGVVRVWPDQSVVSTMFSASNGPRTAGGQFTAVDDPWDDVRDPDEGSCKFHHPCNPNHTWTRVIDADTIASAYGLNDADDVSTAPDPARLAADFEGIWANRVVLGNGSTVSAWDFRGDFGLPSPGFELVPIRRTLSDAASFAFIGDSVGTGIVGSSTRPFEVLTEGVFSSSMFDALGSRRTDGGLQPDGVTVAETVPVGTDLVVVELGYNDDPAAMPGRIDSLMGALRDRDVERVAWVTVSERRDSPDYAATNAALRDARSRWSELVVIDWHAASSHGTAARWYSDGVHLTSTGNAEFSLWLRDQVLGLLDDGYVPPPTPRRLLAGTVLRVPVLGVGGVPESGVSGVALNVTSVGSSARGNLRVWPCGLERPGTSSVNYVAGVTTPNAVVVPVDETGEVCVWSLAETDVLVDVSAWFGESAAVSSASERIVDTRNGIGPIPPR